MLSLFLKLPLRLFCNIDGSFLLQIDGQRNRNLALVQRTCMKNTFLYLFMTYNVRKFLSILLKYAKNNFDSIFREKNIWMNWYEFFNTWFLLVKNIGLKAEVFLPLYDKATWRCRSSEWAGLFQAFEFHLRICLRFCRLTSLSICLKLTKFVIWIWFYHITE